MKKYFILLIICFIFVFLSLGYAFYSLINIPNNYFKERKIINLVNIISQGTKIETKYELNDNVVEKIRLNKISITSYNNHSNQTDDSPNIMASNRLVYEGAIAISKDLKEKYKLRWGDIIYIETLQRYFIIEDLMNERFKNRLDIFSFDKNWSLNFHLKNQTIIIYKVKR